MNFKLVKKLNISGVVNFKIQLFTNYNCFFSWNGFYIVLCVTPTMEYNFKHDTYHEVKCQVSMVKDEVAMAKDHIVEAKNYKAKVKNQDVRVSYVKQTKYAT